MALITLKTNLKSLKYSNDLPGGGYSGLPYIKTTIPGISNSEGTGKPIFRISSTGNLDYPIRGGNVDFNIGTQTFTLSSQVDKTRIRKFFEDAPRGTAFIQKQIGLQLSNPKIETGNTLYGLGQGDPVPGLLENTRVYNRGVNTLTQVGVQGTGAHAIRHGLMPFNPWQKNYYATVNKQNVDRDSSTNRLLILNNLKMSSGNAQFANTQNIANVTLVNSLGISTNKNILFQYWGGPDSSYGIGTTSIKRAVDTTQAYKTLSINAMSYDDLRSQKSNEQSIKGKTTYKLTDFRNTTQTYGWTDSPLQIENRFYVRAGSYKDKMNSEYPFIFKNDKAPWEINADKTDDLVKFVFEAISNDDPTKSVAIFFRAFLTAGITDNNAATLNAFKYMGRGEDFFTYQGFSRTINFSFRVAAGSRDELRPLYNKVNALVSQVYPDYSPDNGVMRSSVVRVTMGDYLYRVPGFLESVNITVDNNIPWEINLEKSQVGDVAQLPQVLDVAISFKPIMDILPRRIPTVETELINNDDTINEKGTVPKLIGTNPENNFINPFAFKRVGQLNNIFKEYSEPADEIITSDFISTNTPTYQANPLIFNPRKNPFASEFEKRNNLNIGG